MYVNKLHNASISVVLESYNPHTALLNTISPRYTTR